MLLGILFSILINSQNNWSTSDQFITHLGLSITQASCVLWEQRVEEDSDSYDAGYYPASCIAYCHSIRPEWIDYHRKTGDVMELPSSCTDIIGEI